MLIDQHAMVDMNGSAPGGRMPCRLVALWLLLLVMGVVRPAVAAPLSDDEMTANLVQTVCLDQAGNPVRLLPVDPACDHHRLQAIDDTATYRKHDWPDRLDPRLPPAGYQASDSVLQPAGPRPVIIQTFDFGDTRRVFGHFDAGQGDGGQAVMLIDGSASIAMTEDGGDGVQWFIGDNCRGTARPERHFLGWLLFRNDVTDRWHDAVTHLNKGRSPSECPARFNMANTRYRTDKILFPFRILDAHGALQTTRSRLDVVVSEHYGAGTIASADHLERFYLAKGLGLVRWERWAHPSLLSSYSVSEAADRLSRSERCPAIEPEQAPDAGWKRVDCRTWTTLLTQPDAWSVARFDWPAPEALRGLGTHQAP
ncbi:MAG: hypothetical protein QOH05_4412 [Acetobacteraceae bacterium]|nr:hypothetical protein [Acetobacteraceae bacterium]